MIVSLEGSRIGQVYGATVGRQELKHSHEPPRHRILVHRQDLEEEMGGQGDAVVVAFD